LEGHPLRRRIVVQVPLDPEALQARLHERLLASGGFDGRIRRQAILVWLAKPARKWWSPCLDLNVFQDEGGGVRLEGYACAHPQLMTAFTFGTIFLTFMASFSAVWSSVQWTMDEPPKCLMGTGLALLGLVGIGTARYVGQRFADGQIALLTTWLDGALGSEASPRG
jgi:hypothetical protein